MMMFQVLLIGALLMDGWGEGFVDPASVDAVEPDAAIKPLLPRRWEFRGNKDQKITDAMNERLAMAQAAHDQYGRDLAKSFGIEYDDTIPDSVQFYDSGQNITALRLTQKYGGTFAFTKPHSRAIMLPGRELSGMKPEQVRNLILHEVMHSHGLPEEDRAAADRIAHQIDEFMKGK